MSDFKVKTTVEEVYRSASISADIDNNGVKDHVSIENLAEGRGKAFARLNEEYIDFWGSFDPKNGFTGEIKMNTGENTTTVISVVNGCLNEISKQYSSQIETSHLIKDGPERQAALKLFDRLNKEILSNDKVVTALAKVTEAIYDTGKLPSQIDKAVKEPLKICLS